MRQKSTVRASSVWRRRGVWLGWAIFCSLVRGDYDGPFLSRDQSTQHTSSAQVGGIPCDTLEDTLSAGNSFRELTDETVTQAALLVSLLGEAGGLLVADLVLRLELLVFGHQLSRGVVASDKIGYLGVEREHPEQFVLPVPALLGGL